MPILKKILKHIDTVKVGEEFNLLPILIDEYDNYVNRCVNVYSNLLVMTNFIKVVDLFIYLHKGNKIYSYVYIKVQNIPDLTEISPYNLNRLATDEPFRKNFMRKYKLNQLRNVNN
jgi:hypothetical protein